MKSAIKFSVFLLIACLFSGVIGPKAWAINPADPSAPCLAILLRYPEVKLVKVYAGPGVIIPRVIECAHCGGQSLMPASLKDKRFEIHNSNDEKNRGASLECEGCGAHNPLWKVDRNGNPIGRAKTQRLKIKTDHVLKKRYVELPVEYKELADPNSEFNQMVKNQNVHICESCSTTTILPVKPNLSEMQCENCGTGFSKDRVFHTGKLMEMEQNRKAQRKRQKSGEKDASSSERAQHVSSDDLILARNARNARSSFMKDWLIRGTAAVGLLSSAAYWYANVPVVATGEVTEISQGVAMVKFQESPYYHPEASVKTYEVQVSLDKRMSLPGEHPFQVQVGGAVSVHYEWADFHVLPFVFHPFTGAEYLDGSFTMGEYIGDK